MTGLSSTNIGLKPLRRWQFGKEATPGTGVIATAMMRSDHSMQDDSVISSPSENVGIYWDTTRNYTPMRGSTLTLPDAPATFEQLPYLAEMGVKALATGAADGGGTGKIYTYPFPTTRTTANAINTYSFETGDDLETWFNAYNFLKSWKISGKYDSAVMMGASFQGRTVAPNKYTASTIAFDNAHHITDSASGLLIYPAGSKLIATGTANNNATFTVTVSTAGQLTVTETTATEAAGSAFTLAQTYTGVSVPAVNTILFNQSKLYIDPVAGAFGGTQKTGTFLSFEHNYTSGWQGQPAGDGRLDFSFGRFSKPSGTAKLTMVHEATAAAEYAYFRSNTPRLFRIMNQGALLTSAGTTYTYFTMILDFVGFYTKFAPPADDNNMDTIAADIKLAYDTTAASAGQLLIVNQLTSLT